MTSRPTHYGLQQIHDERLIQRELDELTGLCKGALLDGCISQIEADGIYNWLNANVHCLDTWPANILYERLHAMLGDGALDADEQGELLGLLLNIAQPPRENGTTPSALPIDTPPPPIAVEGHSFCFTGVFDFGSRAQCHEAVKSRGGIAVDSITKKLHYLVIGAVGSEFWKHSNFGTKIAKAVDYRDHGSPLIIVAEAHWMEHLR
jgi:NAD-dependent DNA ligase